MHNMSYQSPIPPAGAAASRRRPACRYLCLLSIMWNTATISPGMRRSHLSHGRAHVSAAPHANRGEKTPFGRRGELIQRALAREHKPFTSFSWPRGLGGGGGGGENNHLKTKLRSPRPAGGSPRVSQHRQRGQIKTKWLGGVFVQRELISDDIYGGSGGELKGNPYSATRTCASCQSA